jgi:hypothetical protein
VLPTHNSPHVEVPSQPTEVEQPLQTICRPGMEPTGIQSIAGQTKQPRVDSLVTLDIPMTQVRIPVPQMDVPFHGEEPSIMVNQPLLTLLPVFRMETPASLNLESVRSEFSQEPILSEPVMSLLDQIVMPDHKP